MRQEYITSKEMRALEVNAEYFGISLLQLMENAGRNVAAEIESRFKKDFRIVIFCGLGGNGGDGFVAARHLLSLGFSQIAVVLSRKEQGYYACRGKSELGCPAEFERKHTDR